MRTLFTFLVMVGCCVDQLPTLPTLPPVDEARQDPALQAVRDQVLKAIKARNARTLMSFVSQNLVADSMPEAQGISWRTLDEQLSSPNWEHWAGMEGALTLGGRFTTTRGAVEGRREFCAPYVFAGFPKPVPAELVGERAPWVITAKDVDVHAAPDTKSAILGRLSYSIVQATGAAIHDPAQYDRVWQSIDLPEDREGFVAAEKIRDPEGYHVCFANEGGTWLISSLARRGLV